MKISKDDVIIVLVLVGVLMGCDMRDPESPQYKDSMRAKKMRQFTEVCEVNGGILSYEVKTDDGIPMIWCKSGLHMNYNEYKTREEQ